MASALPGAAPSKLARTVIRRGRLHSQARDQPGGLDSSEYRRELIEKSAPWRGDGDYCRATPLQVWRLAMNMERGTPDLGTCCADGSPVEQDGHAFPASVFVSRSACAPDRFFHGGPAGACRYSRKLPAVIDRAPVLITQHMPPTFTTVLAEHLSRIGNRGAHEAEHGEPVLAGGIYVAPGGRHMRIARDRRWRPYRAWRRSADQFLQSLR